MSLLLLDSDYNIRSELFSNNEQGLWLDPSDMNATKAAWRRNLLTYSEQFDNAVWTKTASSVSANSTTAPDGTTTAEKLIEDNTNASHYVASANISLGANTTYTATVYAKKGERTRFQLLISGFVSFSETADVVFDLDTGTVAGGQTARGSIQDVGNGWYRCSARGTVGASATTQAVWIRLVNTGTTTSYSGDGTSGVFIWGAQLETGSTPTEYQRITDFSTEFKAAFPTHTLYQDSNGVTPCTAAGDPVGLILDQSRGGLANLGPELLTNGGFDADSDWTKGTGWSISGGKADYTTGAGILSQDVGLVANRWYRIDVQLIVASAITFRVYCGNSAISINAVVTTSGTYTFYAFSAGVNSNIGFSGSSTGSSYSIDNISVREVPGNHAYQSSSGARPTLARIPSSGRRNLLNESERFDQAYWTKSGGAITANAIANPVNGAIDADLFTENSSTSTHYIDSSSRTFAATAHTISVYAKTNGRRYLTFQGSGLVFGVSVASFDLENGTVSSFSAGTTANIESLGNGWYRCAWTVTTLAATGVVTFLLSDVSGTKSRSYTGDGVSGVYLWGAQLETGSSATNYQRVGSTHDVTESGVGDLWHLVFDGSDDSLVTNAVGFHQATEGIRKNFAINSDFITASTGVDVVAKADATTGLNSLTKTDSTTPRYVSSAGDSSFMPLGNTAYTVSTRIKYNGHDTEFSIEYNQSFPWGGISWIARFNVTASSVTVASVNACTAAVINEEGGVYRISATFTTGASPSAGSTSILYRITGGTGVSIFAGDTQVEVGPSPTTYQRVGTDEMTVIAGVRKLSDAAANVMLEFTPTINSNNGSFAIYGGHNSTASGSYWSALSRGTSTVAARSPQAFAAPVTSVVCGSFDISSDTCVLRVNGSQSGTDSTDQGTGNYSNAVLYIGRRASSSLPFNGHLYQLIVRGKTTPEGKLLEAERFVGRKTGVTGI